MPEFIQTDITNQVARVTLNRPEKRNALTRNFVAELNSFVEEVAENDSIRLFVLRANGQVFCAGMDLAEMKSRAAAEDPEKEWQIDSDVYNQLVSRVFSLKIPTLAVLPGPVLAGGTGMVFACDMVLAADQAFVSLPEPKRGIVAAMVCPLLLYRAGNSTATYLLLSGKPISAAQAKEKGLFHEVVPANELQNAEKELIESILTGSPMALQMTKSHLKSSINLDLENQLKTSAELSSAARKTEDAQEGLAAFSEKRPPKWEVKLES